MFRISLLLLININQLTFIIIIVVIVYYIKHKNMKGTSG